MAVTQQPVVQAGQAVPVRVVPAEKPFAGTILQDVPTGIAFPLIVALVTILVKLVWSGCSRFYRSWRVYFGQVLVESPIDLRWLDEALEQIHVEQHHYALYCLVVRFGTDDYLSSLGSEQDRFEGRLINRVVPVDLSGPDVKLRIPVHSRLGTQFKLYILADTPANAGSLYDQLAAHDVSKLQTRADGSVIYGQDMRRKILLDPKPAGRKIWFRLGAFGTQVSKDQFPNNYFEASRIRDFERRNRLRWLPFRTVIADDA